MFGKLYQIFIVLILAILIAGIFSVPVRKINVFFGKKVHFLRHRKKLRNLLAVFTWYLFLGISVLALGGLFYYNLYRYFSNISWTEFVQMFQDMINQATAAFPILKTNRFQIDTSIMLDILLKFPAVVGKLIISILISIYLLIDWDSYINDYRSFKRRYLSKKTNRFVTSTFIESKEILFSYLKAQFMDALIMGFLISIGLKFLKVPLGIPIGILAGIGNMIPYAGPIIAFSFTIIFCLLEQRVRTLIFALIYLIIIQQLDGSYIGPKIIGRELKLRPLFIIISILVGGTLFGILGMIFAVPLTCIVKTIIKKYFERK